MIKPKLAAFPKCFIHELCVNHTMTLFDWIEMASTLEVDGLEFYSGFLIDDPAFLGEVKDRLQQHGLVMPILCCSPDFPQPDPVMLNAEIEREKRMIELTAFFGGKFCRVLSGQRYPGLSREAGVAQVVSVLKSLLPFAEKHDVVLTMENHYKDSFWRYPEFAQKMEAFLEIVEQIDSPWFGVNFDPSNTLLAGKIQLNYSTGLNIGLCRCTLVIAILRAGRSRICERKKTRSGTPAGWPMASSGKALTTMTRFLRFCVRLNLIRGSRSRTG